MASGSVWVNTGTIPIGYETPKWPSLSWDFSGNPYESPLLYRTWDIYRFTIYWFLITSTAEHLAVALIAVFMQRKLAMLWVLIGYAIAGALFGFVIGSISGLILAAIYRAGVLHMTTWIPFAWSVLVMIFMTMSSYATTPYIL